MTIHRDRPVSGARTKARVGARRAKAVAPLALALLWAAGMSPLGAQEATFYTTVEGISEYRLDNGLRVLLFPDASQPQTTVNITYFVGSRHEAYGETGMAHLLEHLVFKGTPSHPNIPQEMSERGSQPNGTTWLDRTNYFQTFPASSENLAWALGLEADRMVNSFISAEDLASEMTVVRNEWEAGENNPFGVLMKRMNSIAYLWHNYGNSTIGARSDLENVPIERLQAFYRRHYQPDNAQLVVAGQFDPDEALAVITEVFGAIPAPDRTGELRKYPTYTVEPVQDGERSVTLRRAGDTKLVAHLYHVPNGYHEDYPAIDLLTWILGDEPSGRLYTALVEPGLAAAVNAGADQYKEPGALTMIAVLGEDGDEQAVEQAMSDAVQDVLTRPITGEEVERARQARLSGIERLFNNSRAVALQLSEWGAMGDWRLFFVHRDRLRETTAEDVQRVALSYLKPSNRTVGIFVPEDNPDRVAMTPAPDIRELVDGYEGAEAVAQGEIFEATPENIDRRTRTAAVTGGMEVALLSKDTRGETVVATLTLRLGDEGALTGRMAESDLAASMLMRGTTERSRQEIEDEMNRLQARVSVGGGGATVSGRVEATREHFADALRLLGEVLREPAFPEEEFRTLKEQRRVSLEAQRSEPQSLAILALQRHMSPHQRRHPRYVPTIEESLEEIDAVTLEEVRDFYRTLYGAASATMSVVGDFDDAEALSVVEDIFGDWVSTVSFARIDDDYVEVPPDDIQIETPDKTNAMFLAGQLLPMADHHDDVPALLMANYLLGGGFLNSRLATRVRQEEGLSYGVQSVLNFHPIDRRANFIALAIYAPENRDKLEAAVREEIQKVLDEGFTDDEVASGVAGYLERASLGRSDDGALAGVLNSNLYFDRTMAWQAAQEDRVRSLTADDINQAFRRWIDLEKMTFVKAGDFANTTPIIP